eukprot:2718946-Amphidinium_carterae.1
MHLEGSKLMTVMQSDEWQNNVTSRHISHFECLIDVERLEQHQMPSVEIISGLLRTEPGKIVATMEK